MEILINNTDNHSVMWKTEGQDMRATLCQLTDVGHILTFLSSLTRVDANKATEQFSIKFLEIHFFFVRFPCFRRIRKTVLSRLQVCSK